MRGWKTLIAEDLVAPESTKEEALYNIIGMEDGWIKYDEKAYVIAKDRIMMNWKECLEKQKQECKFLDTLDLKPFLEKDKSVYDVMEEIEDKYGDQYTEESFIFNCMDHNDFIDYIQERYNKDIRFYEYTDWRVR